MNNFPAMNEAQRQELVNWLEEGIACRDEYGFSGNVLKSMQIALSALAAPPAPVLRVQDGWIKCSERYPAPHEWVLVYAKWANQQVICWDHVTSKWTDFYEQNYHKEMFSHWQPLPPPPEASNEKLRAD